MNRVIYNKSTGLVQEVLDSERFCNIDYTNWELPDELAMLSVDTLPKVDKYRQVLAVTNGLLQVVDLELSDDEENEIVVRELEDEANELEYYLMQTDSQALKFADGELSTKEWNEIKAKRLQTKKFLSEKREQIEEAAKKSKLRQFDIDNVDKSQ